MSIIYIYTRFGYKSHYYLLHIGTFLVLWAAWRFPFLKSPFSTKTWAYKMKQLWREGYIQTNLLSLLFYWHCLACVENKEQITLSYLLARLSISLCPYHELGYASYHPYFLLTFFFDGLILLAPSFSWPLIKKLLKYASIFQVYVWWQKWLQPSKL